MFPIKDENPTELKPYATIFGHHIYEVYHPLTNQNLYINNGDITR